MSEKDKVIDVEELNKVEETPKATDPEKIIEPESKTKKVVKTVLKGLALVATAIGGFLLGRATKGDNDSDAEATQEEAA